MAILLVQHGKNNPKEKDPDQGLTDEGIVDVLRIAKLAKNYGIQVTRIIHSGKTRAMQTAELFASELEPKKGIEEVEGIKPLDDVKGFVHMLQAKEHLMVVGHLPFLEKLTSYLITGSEEKKVFDYQNGGIVCLERHEETASYCIKWALMPHIVL